MLDRLKQVPGVLAVLPTGSRVICNPPTHHTDEDFVVFVDKTLYNLATDQFKLMGFTSDSEAGYEDGEEVTFESFHDDEDYNLIVVWDTDMYRRWVLATKVATTLNLLHKGDRILLFKAFLYDEEPLL